MIKPLKTIWFFIVVGIFLSISIIAIPTEGLNIAGFNIHMPSFKEMISKDTSSYADISNIVNDIENIDSLPDITEMIEAEVPQEVVNIEEQINPKDTAKANAGELAKSIYRLQFPNGDNSGLKKFFAKLTAVAKNKTSIRIMHYGDSQLEGDRITSYLRNKLQKKYGGSGPGLLPALQPYGAYFSIDQSNEGNWTRYPIFGKVNKAVEHKRYGPLAAFSRFSPIIPDSLYHDSIQYSASIIFGESKLAYSSVRSFQKVKLLYGNAKRPTSIKLYVDEQLVKEDSLKALVDFASYDYTIAAPTKNLKIELNGYDSPDIYGIALDGINGVSMDNIGMRGSSGTIFRKIDYAHLKKTYDKLDVELFIMQFGGNVMPYIKDSSEAVNYGRWFYNQIRTIKKMRPSAYIIVIGPSDMSHKVGEKYETYAFLDLVNGELKKAAFKAGFAYWDMYNAMGGYNSMPSWVRSQPPLAGSDYTHFTPRGAKLIANMFYNALMIESLK